MERVTGIGGVFFKTQDPKALLAWYAEKLGVPAEESFPGAAFRWREADDPDRLGQTIWSLFPANTSYFGANSPPFMINYRVADLDRMLAQLRAAGVSVDEKVEESEYGKFGWATDPDGNRFELWQPPERMPEG